MPRGRRAKKAANRPSPKMPEGDEGQDLSRNTRLEKLDVLIKDFDAKAKAHIDSLKSYKRELLNNLKTTHRRELVRFKPIANMKIKDFLKYPGDTDQQTSQDKCQEDDILTEKQIEHVKEEINARFKLEKFTTSKRGVAMDTIAEDPGTENQPPATRRKGMSVGAGGSTATKSVARPASARAAHRSSKFVTPYHGALGKNSAMDTPLVTPKFDNRLPITPWMGRQCNPSEKRTVLQLSMAGSPIAQKEDDVGILVGGTAISEDQLMASELTGLDPAITKKLRIMSEKLQNILKMQGAEHK